VNRSRLTRFLFCPVPVREDGKGTRVPQDANGQGWFEAPTEAL
jgi:hypothetical protein